MKLPFLRKADRRHEIESALMDLHAKIHSEQSYARKVLLTHKYAELQKEYQGRFGNQFDVESQFSADRNSSLDDMVG